MSRKDDPVFNVKFVHLIENHPCLWNSKLPAYSRKDETQKAWDEVSKATNETVQNCRERWRTIRSSFLRSLKLSRTSTGRGKRKYYLSKYLQFLIPYTKTRPKNNCKTNSTGAAVAAAAVAATSVLPPMTHISNMPDCAASNDDTKDYGSTEVEIAEEDVVVSLHEGSGASGDGNPGCSHSIAADIVNGVNASVTDCGAGNGKLQCKVPLPIVFPLPLQRLTAIKTEVDANTTSTNYQRHTIDNGNGGGSGGGGIDYNGTTTTATIQHQHQQQQHQQQQQQHHQQQQQQPHISSASAVDFTEFAEWIKSKNAHQRHCLIPSTLSPDADQSFLNSLHPYMREMSGKQNRRFRQKVVALIDAILDNTD